MQLTLSGIAVPMAAHCMPPPQYLGAKHRLLPWIGEFVPADAAGAVDGFAGSQSFSSEMKRRGLAVHANDFLGFCRATGVALIKNGSEILTEQDVDLLCADTAAGMQRRNTMKRFAGIFFSESECAFLDNFRANVDLLDNPHKRALALTVICRCLTRKTTMGHFAHLCAIPYTNDPLCVKRNAESAPWYLFLSHLVAVGSCKGWGEGAQST